MQASDLILNGSNTGIRILTADTFYTKLVGLTGKNNIDIDAGLLIPACNSIHTFFMKVPIDAVFVDRDNKIVDIEFNLKPWKVVLPVAQARTTLELASGSAAKLNLKKGDTITFLEIASIK